MAPRPTGNTKLKAARQHAGYSSQASFADALTAAAPRIGLGSLKVSERQIRRWESTDPPWPQAHHQRLLVHVLKREIRDLGFTAPWESAEIGIAEGALPRVAASQPPLSVPLPVAAAPVQPSTIGADYSAITLAHRRLYWSVQPAHLHPTVVEHTRLGLQLLSETSGVPRRILAAALAESLLLAGRIEFFDLRRPEEADGTYSRALQAAGDAEDPLLGAAVLAHAAFIPGWGMRADDAAERLRAARTYARRGPASTDFLAWIDAVDAECTTRCGHPNEALGMIDRAEKTMATSNEHRPPEWFTWFSGARLAAFKGNTQLVAGRHAQARDTLTAALKALNPEEGKQRVVILGDLAAVETAQRKYVQACERIHEALDQLSLTWYATGMERIRAVRRDLQPWADTDEVRGVDDRLYSWETVLSTLSR
jgi:hypothetical protein